MDPASQALAINMPADIRDSISARARHGKVPRTTVHYRKQGRPTRKEKDQKQQYLTPPKEKALVDFLLRMSASGSGVRIKYIPSLAHTIARRRATNQPTEPPKRKWPQAFQKRHPELKARMNRAIALERHNNSIYNKVVHWFEVIEPELRRPDVLPENVYNMDKTGIMLSKLSSVKILVERDDRRNYRAAGEKRTMVTSTECVSASGKYLNPMIIWPASTHRSNWTVHPTPGWAYALSKLGYNNSFISLEWIKQVFDLQTNARANGKLRILICKVPPCDPKNPLRRKILAIRITYVLAYPVYYF